MGVMKKIMDLLNRKRIRKQHNPQLFRSYLAFYNGAMETISGRYFLRNNESVNR